MCFTVNAPAANWPFFILQLFQSQSLGGQRQTFLPNIFLIYLSLLFRKLGRATLWPLWEVVSLWHSVYYRAATVRLTGCRCRTRTNTTDQGTEKSKKGVFEIHIDFNHEFGSVIF